MNRIEVDVKTKKKKTIPLSQEEIDVAAIHATSEEYLKTIALQEIAQGKIDEINNNLFANLTFEQADSRVDEIQTVKDIKVALKEIVRLLLANT